MNSNRNSHRSNQVGRHTHLCEPTSLFVVSDPMGDADLAGHKNIADIFTSRPRNFVSHSFIGSWTLVSLLHYKLKP